MEFITLRTITNDLLKIVRSSNVSASETISLRQLEDWVHQYRAVLLKRDLDKGKKPNPDYIQEIGNLILERVDLSGDDVTSLGVESGSFIYRTLLSIPKTLDLNFSSGFTYIGTPAGNKIQLVPEGRTEWQKYKKYTQNSKLAFLRNEHFYIVNSEALEFITVRGVFEIPSEVGRFVNPITNQPYFSLDSKYPMPANLIPALKDMVLQKELKIETTSPTDVTNDTRNNPENVSNKFA
jgi:hypothetical protein